MNRKITLHRESWPLVNPFVISRGSRTETEVVKIEIAQGEHMGMGECVPSPRYAESASSVMQQIERVRALLSDGATREELLIYLPHGSARNAVDAALWDLQAKIDNQHVGASTGLGWPQQIQTAQTISIDSSENMAHAAFELHDYPVIKVKLDQHDIVARMRAVHANAPDATLLIDANESWTFDLLSRVAPELQTLGVAMIEQPLPANDDETLRSYNAPIPLYADESCHTRADLPMLLGKYQGINIKLDKTGGLTEAIALLQESQSHRLEIMVGCMVSTSLGIAPAMFVAQYARWVDLDAPTLLSKDRSHALRYKNGLIDPLPKGFWGGGRVQAYDAGR